MGKVDDPQGRISQTVGNAGKPLAAVMDQSTSRPSLLRSLRWTFLLQTAQQGMTLAVGLVLAALLGPDQFGAVAMALVVVELLYQVLEQGFGIAVVQRRELSSAQISSVFVLLLSGGAVCWFAATVLGYVWAVQTSVPVVGVIMPVLAFVIPLNALAVVPHALIQRALQFRTLTCASLAASISSATIGVALATAGFGVWAIVAQQVSAAAVNAIVLFAASRWVPSWQFSWSALLEVVRFSASVFVGNFATVITNRVDALVIGSLFGPAAVGLYRIAARLVNSLSDLTTRPFHMIALPHLSREQSEHRAFRATLLKSIHGSLLVAGPAFAALAICADPLIGLLGSEWAPAVPALRVLCVLGIVKAFTVFVAPVLLAIGRSGLFAAYSWGIAVVTTGAFVAMGFAVRGMEESSHVLLLAVARALSFVAVSVLAAWLIYSRLLRVSLGELVRTAAVPMVVTAAAAAAGLFAAQIVESLTGSSVVRVIAIGGFAAAVSAGVALLLSEHAQRLAAPLLVRFRSGGPAGGLDTLTSEASVACADRVDAESCDVMTTVVGGAGGSGPKRVRD